MNKGKVIKICDYITEISLLAIIFFTPIYFAFAQETFNIFELNKLVVMRALLMIILVAFVGKVFIFKEAKLSRGNLASLAPLFFLIGLLGISFFVSTFFSIHPQLSLWGSYSRQQGFYTLIHYLLFFVLFILYFYPDANQSLIKRNWQKIKRIIITIMLSSALVCLYGLMQYFAFDPLRWKEAAIYTGRIFSSLGQPNFLAQYLVIILPISVFSLFFIFKKFISRFLAAILILTQLACLLFTYSRAAWLAFMASLTVFIIVFFFIKRYKKLAWGLISIGLASIIIIISFNILKPPSTNQSTQVNLVNRFRSIFDLNSGSNKIRLYYWQAGLSEFKTMSWQRKIIGYGPETLASIYIKYYQPDWGVYETINTFPDRAHNAILDTILQFGLMGLIIIALLYYYIFLRVYKYLRNPKPGFKAEYWLIVAMLVILVGYFINNLFSFSLTVGYIYLYTVLAILIVIIIPRLYPLEKITEEKERKFFSSFSKLLIWLALFSVCGVFIYYYNIKAISADYYYMEVKKAEKKGDCRIIIELLDKVVSLNPVSTFYKEKYIHYGLNCFEAIKSREEKIKMHSNIVEVLNFIEPKEYQSSTWAHIAHMKSVFGYFINPSYYEQAKKDYEYLIKLNPHITMAYRDLGKMKLWQGDYEEAMVNFKKAIKASPSLDSPYLNDDHRQEIENELVYLYEMLGKVYSYKEEWDNAMEYYREALKFDPWYLPLYKKIADVYYQQGDLDNAIRHNKRGYMLNPEDYNWPFALAFLYQEKGDQAKALKYAKEALELEPGNEQVKKFVKEFEPYEK